MTRNIKNFFLVKNKLFTAILLSLMTVLVVWTAWVLNNYYSKVNIAEDVLIGNFGTHIPVIINIIIFLLLGLTLFSINVTRNHMMIEEENKKLLQSASEKNKEKVEYFKRLNDSYLGLMAEINFEDLLTKILEICMKQSSSEKGAIFFLSDQDGDSLLRVKKQFGFEPIDFVDSIFKVRTLLPLVSYRNIIDSREGDAAKLAKTFFTKPLEYKNWIFAPLYTRFNAYDGISLDGFVILSKNENYSDTSMSIVQSIIANARIAIENAKLVKKAEEASLAKSAFLANMSHEIRTPLGAIMGFSEILIKNHLTEEQKETFIHNIKKNGKQLTRLIDDILDISKVEAGKLLIQKNKVKILNLIAEIQSLMRLKAKEKGISFHVSNQGMFPSHILTDEVRLKQILINLIGNAIKFTDKGLVKLIFEYKTDARFGKNYLEFIIQDTGVGISEEAKEGLFQAFNQGDVSSTRRFSGTGLGLALSRKIATTLGGDVTLLESSLGRGSTFLVRVETEIAENALWTESLGDREIKQILEKDLETDSKEKPLNNKKILLVEDSPDNQEIFAYFLTTAGAQLEICEDGLAAVEKGLHNYYDIILMDIQIPKIDGKEATRRLRQKGYDNPIIALTAHAMIEEVKSCMEAGCNGQITKPVTKDDLVMDVKGYINQYQRV